MKQWVLHGKKGIDSLTLEKTRIPQPGENEVLIKLHAVSLNYRDLMIATVSTMYFAPVVQHTYILTLRQGNILLEAVRPRSPRLRRSRTSNQHRRQSQTVHTRTTRDAHLLPGIYQRQSDPGPHGLSSGRFIRRRSPRVCRLQ